MKMLEDGGDIQNPLRLLYQIKRAKAMNGRTGTMPLAPPALTTIGEANSKAGTSPAMMWAGTIFIVCLSIGGTSAFAYTLYSHHFFPADRSWCLLALILWGVYVAVVAVVMAYMTLFLPNAPVALREALVDIGWIYVGQPVMAINMLLMFFGQPWMVITMFYCLGILIAGVLAFWGWLALTYRKCA
ncbi:hypothetical protein ACQJBY_050217 [Aegilops geniculata]